MSSYFLLRFFMLALGLYGIWLGAKGAYTGKVDTPSKYGSNVFSRTSSPAKFWLSVAYFLITGAVACVIAITWR
jgi:hypothetical protein